MPGWNDAESTEVVTPPQRPKRVGARELSKQESQHKIMVAARQLFAELGYDRATLRQIAAKAGLTVGALFNHVTDKRDLIYLIFNEEVNTVTETALASPRSYQPFRDKVLSVTEHYFRLFGSEPILSRILLTEVVVLSPGLHLDRYLELRARLVDGLEELVLQSQHTGEIQATDDADLIARYIFFTFASSLRWWLASATGADWRSGHREFERLLNLQMNGLIHPNAKKVAQGVKKRATRRKRIR